MLRTFLRSEQEHQYRCFLKRHYSFRNFCLSASSYRVRNYRLDRLYQTRFDQILPMRRKITSAKGIQPLLKSLNISYNFSCSLIIVRLEFDVARFYYFFDIIIKAAPDNSVRFNVDKVGGNMIGTNRGVSCFLHHRFYRSL